MRRENYPADADTLEFLPTDLQGASQLHQLVRVSDYGAELDRYSVTASVISIGRGPSNKICLPHATVSRRHARLWVVGDICWIEDLSSSNGTFVNDAKILRQRLVNGDQIKIGAIKLKMEISQKQTPDTVVKQAVASAR